MDLIQHYKQVRFRLWNAAQIPKIKREEPIVEQFKPEEKPTESCSQTIIVPRRRIQGLSGPRSEDIYQILDKYDVSWKDVIGRSRKKKYISIRAEVYAYLLNHGFSKSHIGKICNRDHTSILHILNTYSTDNTHQGALQ